MKKAIYTPGPWKVGENDCAIKGYTDIESRDWGALASVATGNQDALGEGQANAKLIAAAPELLETCQEALAFIAGLTPFPNDNEDETLREAINTVADKANKVTHRLRTVIAKATAI